MRFQRAQHGSTFLVQPVFGIPAAEADFHGLAQGGIHLLHGKVAAEIGERENLFRSTIGVEKNAGIRHIRQAANQIRQPITGSAQVFRPGISRRQDAHGQFFRRGTAEACDVVGNRAAEMAGFEIPQAFIKRFAGQIFRVQLALGGRGQIGHAWLHLAYPAHIRTDMACGFKNTAAFIQQHQVGMAAHDLQHQPAKHMVAHFVDGIQVHMNHTVAFDLTDFRDACTGQLLPHEHAQCRRFQRVGKRTLCQMAAGIVRRGAKKQPVILASCTNHQNHRIPLRLGDFIHPAALQDPVQLPGGKSYRQSVHRHRLFLSL